MEFQTLKENVQANVRSLGRYVSQFILPDILTATPQAFKNDFDKEKTIAM